MAKIIGNTTATPNPQPDWNQTDATKADYIKNKPDISKMEGIATTDYVDEQVATKTQITVGGNPVETFDADTKVSQYPGNTGGVYILYIGRPDGTTGYASYQTSIGTSAPDRFPKFMNANFPPDDSIVSGYLTTNIPVKQTHAANKKYVDDNFVSKNGDSAINGNFSITGDLHIAGTTYTEDAETIRIADNIIELNSTKQDNSTLLSGVAINKNTASTYGIMYDPTDDTVKFGEGKTENGVFAFNNEEGAPLTVRDDSSNIADGAIMIFDKSKNRIVDSGYTIDGFKQWVRDYIETYMSTEMVISNNSAGGETLDINTNNYTEENGTLMIGG